MGTVRQQCLTFGDSPVQLIASERATDIMIAGPTPPRAEKYCLGSCYGRNCENWGRRACDWALQDNALFIIIEMGSATASCSIRYSTLMKNKITRRAYLKACNS